MGRPATHTRERILECATAVAARHGPQGATVARVADALQGPSGSIYHRFESRSVLLGEVWLRTVAKFQRGAAERLAGEHAVEAGLSCALYVSEWVRERPDDARILLLYRSADFLAAGWPAAMKRRATVLRRDLQRSLRSFCTRLTGRVDARRLKVISFMLADAPLAAVRRHVESGEVLPPVVDALIESTYRANLGLLGVKA